MSILIQWKVWSGKFVILTLKYIHAIRCKRHTTIEQSFNDAVVLKDNIDYTSQPQ